MRSHLASPAATNWSMITWAPLAKSPNWASQIASALGSAMEWPYSNPSTPASERRLSASLILAWSGLMLLSGM